jgi:acetylornithine/N-succinyldiaminopimelate aminotransferase
VCVGRLTEAITAQMGTLHHVSNLYYTAEQGGLGAWLVKNSCADK